MGDTIREEDAFVCTKENPKVPDLDARTSELLCNGDCFKCFSSFIPGDIHDEVDVILKDQEIREVTVTLAELVKELERLEDELEKRKKPVSGRRNLVKSREKYFALKILLPTVGKTG